MIDNFYFLQPDTAFAKPKATVTLYIDNEKIYFKEFDGAFVKGKTDPKIFFKDSSGNEVKNNKFISTTENVPLTISSEKYDGLQTRIEASSLLLRDLTKDSNPVPVVSNPTKNQTEQENFNLAVTIYPTAASYIENQIIKAKLFMRTQVQENWTEITDSTHYYTTYKDDNLRNIRFDDPFVRSIGEDFSFTFSIPAMFANNKLRFVVLQSNSKNIGFVNADTGKISKVAADSGLDSDSIILRDSIVNSIEFTGNNNGADPITINKNYNFTLKGLKKNEKIPFSLRLLGKVGVGSDQIIFDILVK